MKNGYRQTPFQSKSSIETDSNSDDNNLIKSYVTLNSKEFIKFNIFQFLWIGPWICGTIVLPLFGAQWFGDCLIQDGLSVEVIEGCEPDYVQYNFYLTLFNSIGGAVSFLLAGFIGRLSDSFGRKPFLILAIICWMIPRVTILFYINFFLYWSLALLPDINGGDQILPALKASISDIVSPKDRINAFGRIHGAMGAGLIVGSAFAIAISAQYNNYTVLIITAIWYMVLLLLTICGIKEPIDRNHNRVSISSKVWSNPFRPLTVICQNQFIFILSVLSFCTSLVEGGVMSSLFAYFGHELHLTDDGKAAMVFGIYVTTVSVVLVPISVCFLPFLKRKKVHYSHMIAISVCFRITSLALLVVIGMDLHSFSEYKQYILYSAAAFHGSGMFHFAVLEGIVGEYVAKNCQGVAFGVITSYKGISGIIAPFSFGVLFTQFSDTYLSALFLMVGIFICIIVIWLGYFPLKKLLATTKPQTVQIVLKGEVHDYTNYKQRCRTDEEEESEFEKSLPLSHLVDYVRSDSDRPLRIDDGDNLTAYNSLKVKLVEDEDEATL
eukprot:1070692_1